MIASLHALIAALTIPIVAYPAAPASRAIVDTGGMTESKITHPLDFQTYYRGLGVDYALGVDYLAQHAVSAGTTGGKPVATVALDVRASQGWTDAFVTCTIGRSSYRMLLDTVALAWPSQSASRASAVLFLSSAAFQSLHATQPNLPYHPGGKWIVDSHGTFVEAPSLVARTNCGGVVRSKRVVVERADGSTYVFLRQLFGIQVDGDASLAAFQSRGATIDFRGRALYLY